MASHRDASPGGKAAASDACALCHRQTFLTAHHLIPRKLHRRKWFRKHYTRDELQRVVALCRDCHRGLHKLYDEMTLGKLYNSLDKLRADDAVMKHANWVARRRVATSQRGDHV
jgi:hypothetical protein